MTVVPALLSGMLKNRCDLAAREWARSTGRAVDTGAIYYALLFHRRLVRGEDLPVKPTASQAGYGLTEQDVTVLRPVLMEAVDQCVLELAQDLKQVAPTLSPSATALLYDHTDDAGAA